LLTSDRILNLFSKNPEEAYKELRIAERFDTGMFIKLIIYEQVCSNGKFAFENGKYLMDLVKTSSFNLDDPMLLAYAILKAAKTGGDDLNIKLDIICPPFFDNQASKNLFERYSKIYQSYGKNGFNLYNNKSAKKIYEDIEAMIKAGGNIKAVSKEFTNYVHKISPPEIIELLKPFIPQDVSSTTSTTTTSISTTSSLEKSFTSISSLSTSELQTTTALPLGGDPIDGESTNPTVTNLRTSHFSTILFSSLDPIVAATEGTSTELTGQNSTADTE
jgi:hypothetical protein